MGKSKRRSSALITNRLLNLLSYASAPERSHRPSGDRDSSKKRPAGRIDYLRGRREAPLSAVRQRKGSGRYLHRRDCEDTTSAPFLRRPGDHFVRKAFFAIRSACRVAASRVNRPAISRCGIPPSRNNHVSLTPASASSCIFRFPSSRLGSAGIITQVSVSLCVLLDNVRIERQVFRGGGQSASASREVKTPARRWPALPTGATRQTHGICDLHQAACAWGHLISNTTDLPSGIDGPWSTAASSDISRTLACPCSLDRQRSAGRGIAVSRLSDDASPTMGPSSGETGGHRLVGVRYRLRRPFFARAAIRDCRRR